MNIILGFVSIILTFTCIVVIEKLFKKEGLIVWMTFATVVANIVVVKMVNIFGMTSSLGNILFASNFLATDILVEKYDRESAKKAIKIALVFTLIFIGITQITLLFVPDSTDIAQDAMKQLFALNVRASLASITMYYISNNVDIYIFEKIKKKYPDKLWLRNNVATIISNCTENYIFNFLAFVGIFSLPTIISIATTSTVIEIIIAIMDTPFIYISKVLK